VYLLIPVIVLIFVGCDHYMTGKYLAECEAQIVKLEQIQEDEWQLKATVRQTSQVLTLIGEEWRRQRSYILQLKETNHQQEQVVFEAADKIKELTQANVDLNKQVDDLNIQLVLSKQTKSGFKEVLDWLKDFIKPRNKC